jgi:hypothetical protein
MRVTLNNQLIGLLGFKFVGNSKDVWDVNPMTFAVIWHAMLSSSTKGGGNGFELRAWHTVLYPIELAVERLKD